MKIVAPESWTPCDGVVLEDNADWVVRSNNNVLVVAGPGAGKTEMLAQKACYLFQTNSCKYPKKILAISFKKDSADNLKKRVVKRCGKEIESRFVSMTYDAFSKSILDHFTFALPDDLRPESNYLVNDDDTINAAFKSLGYNNFQNLSQRKLRAHYENVLDSVELPLSQNKSGDAVWKLLLKGGINHKATLSFKMISKLAEYIIKTNPKIKRALQLTYKHVFLDEFQDTTDLQYELVKQCFLHSKSIVTAVGDNKQRIMVWAGARKTIFNDFKTDFNAEEKPLIMNHRSAPRLVDLQKMMYLSLKEKDITLGVSEKWKSDDGVIKLLIAEDDDVEAEVISEQIASQVESGIEPNKICILCKQTPGDYTKKINAKLKAYNIRARVENDFQDLIKEPIVEIIVSLLRLAINRKLPNEWEYVTSTLSDLWYTNSSQPYDAYFRMQKSLDEEIVRLGSVLEATTNQKDFGTLIDHEMEFLGLDHIKAMFPTYNQGTYLDEILDKFKGCMWNKPEIEQIEQIDWTLAIENFLGINSVPIMTIHKSKGLEFDVVYFVGLEDSAFWNFRSQSEEDRCAFFVAISRAKKELMFTFSKLRSKYGGENQKHDEINEFFDLLSKPGVAEIIER